MAWRNNLTGGEKSRAGVGRGSVFIRRARHLATACAVLLILKKVCVAVLSNHAAVASLWVTRVATDVHAAPQRDIAAGYRHAVALDLRYSPAHRGLARRFAAEERWDRALEEYRFVHDKDPISLLAEGEALRHLGRPGDALDRYRASGYLSALETVRRPFTGRPEDPRYTDVASLLVEHAQDLSIRGETSGARQAGLDALAWTHDGGVMAQASEVVSDTFETTGDMERALEYMWRSVSARPGGVADERYSRLARQVIRVLGSRDSPRAESSRDLAYILRCHQWLGEHQTVVDRSQSWLKVSRHAAGVDRWGELIACLLKESAEVLRAAGRDRGGPPADDIGQCLMPIAEALPVSWDPNALTMPVYRVLKEVRPGTILDSVVPHPLDVDLGLPVATHFYWTGRTVSRIAAGGAAAVATYARVTNLTPNAGFEYERLLSLPMTSVFPIGYQRDIYNAPASTRSLDSTTIDGSSETALFLSNSEMAPDSSSGLSSVTVPVDARAVYVQGGGVYRGSPGLFFGRVWSTEPPRTVYDYVKGARHEDSWSRMADLARPDEDVRGAATWLIDFRGRGTVGFDRLFFFRVPNGWSAADGVVP